MEELYRPRTERANVEAQEYIRECSTFRFDFHLLTRQHYKYRFIAPQTATAQSLAWLSSSPDCCWPSLASRELFATQITVTSVNQTTAWISKPAKALVLTLDPQREHLLKGLFNVLFRCSSTSNCPVYHPFNYRIREKYSTKAAQGSAHSLENIHVMMW